MARTRDADMESRILDSAIEVFGNRGFQATTLKDIAAVAGISTGSVYTYFRDKEGLFRAAVAQGWERFIAELETVALDTNLRKARVDALLETGFRTLEAALPLLRGMLFDASRLKLLEPAIERLCTAVEAILRPDIPVASEWITPIPAAKRHTLTRTIILGILSSAALTETVPATAVIRELKEAVAALLNMTHEAGLLGLPRDEVETS